MSALAALVAQSLGGTDRARYLSTATTLASEKLEDLNHWSASAPQVVAGGSLTADTSASSIDYYDDVDLSNTSGQVSESIATPTGLHFTYTNIIHNATGYMNTTATTTPPSTSGVMDFHRRWLIEASPTVNGVTLTESGCRVTVISILVTW